MVGFLLGPEVFGLVTLETFGDGLETVVGLSVAIIVFDGDGTEADVLREAGGTTDGVGP